MQGLPAIDLLAAEHGLAIENLPGVRTVSMALLEGRSDRLVDPQGYLAEAVAANPELFVTGLASGLAAAAAPEPGGWHWLP